MGKETVVLDLGSVFVKCGFAGESAPRCILPSPLDGWLARSKAGERRWGVAEWEEVLGPFLVKLYVHHLRCRPKDRKVVVCEPLAGPSALREAIARVLFHWLKAPALLCAPALTTALHATGADGGLVVDIGYRESHVLAVAHGRPLLHTYQVTGVGAKTTVERVQAGLGGPRRIPWEVAQEIVVRACFVRSREHGQEQVTSLEYDGGVDLEGNTIDIPAELRGSAAEALFVEQDEDALPAAVLRCLKKCPRDLRRGLASHVLVIGGGSMLPGFCGRLAEELRYQASTQPRYQELAAALSSSGEGARYGGLCVVRDACVLAPRNVLAWTGGSVLAVLEEAGVGSSASSRSAGQTVGGRRGATLGEEGAVASRYLSRNDVAEAEALAQAQGRRDGGGPSLLPEWLAVGGRAAEGDGEPN